MKEQFVTVEEIQSQIEKTCRQTERFVQQNHFRQRSCLGYALDPSSPLVGVRFLQRRWKRILGYLLVLHFYNLDTAVKSYIRLDLEELILGSEVYFFRPLLRPDLFLKFLQVQTVMSFQQWCSGVSNRSYLVETLDLILIRFEERLRRPKRKVRHKGYRDKGSLGNVGLRTIQQEWRSDYLNRELELHIAEHQRLRQDEILLFESHLEEGRVLPDELLIKFHLRKEKDYEREATGATGAEREETPATQRQTEESGGGDRTPGAEDREPESDFVDSTEEDTGEHDNLSSSS